MERNKLCKLARLEFMCVEYTQSMGGRTVCGCALYIMPKVCITCTSKLYCKDSPGLVVNIMWMGR